MHKIDSVDNKKLSLKRILIIINLIGLISGGLTYYTGTTSISVKDFYYFSNYDSYSIKYHARWYLPLGLDKDFVFNSNTTVSDSMDISITKYIPLLSYFMDFQGHWKVMIILQDNLLKWE